MTRTEQPLDFVLVGPFKTGTSWMDRVLRTHPGVALPQDLKETFYFSHDEYFERGAAWFDALFAADIDGVKRGEVGPSYFHAVHAPARLHAVAPRCTIVCSFRDPAARLQSFHLHLVQRGEVPADSRLLDVMKQRPFLWETARYGHHLQRWITQFGADRVKVLFYEDLRTDEHALSRSLFAAVGVAPIALEAEAVSAVNAAKVPVDPRLSRLFYGASRRLRRSGLHKVVNVAKRAGLGQLILTELTERPTLDDETLTCIRRRLHDDMRQFENLIERPLPDGWLWT